MAFDVSGMMSENVILVDTEYIDKVAFDLTVNFERMLERRIPKADLAHWIDCVALDGGLIPGDNNVQVIFLYEKKTDRLDNFFPSSLKDEIGGWAFRDNLGEFVMEAYAVADDVTTKEDFYVESLRVVIDNEKVKRVMLVPDVEKYGAKVREVLRGNKEKQVTLFAMEPQAGSGFSQEILGYSLMSALGIRGEEIG